MFIAISGTPDQALLEFTSFTCFYRVCVFIGSPLTELASVSWIRATPEGHLYVPDRLGSETGYVFSRNDTNMVSALWLPFHALSASS